MEIYIHANKRVGKEFKDCLKCFMYIDNVAI